MASKDEKLCMAMIRNSNISKTNFEGVAKELGLGTANAANCAWRRFKAKFEDKSNDNADTPKKGKKRAIEAMSDGEEEKVVRKAPAKKKKGGRKAKEEVTPETEVEGFEQDDVEV